MMDGYGARYPILFLCLVIWGLGGCASTEPTQFFILTPSLQAECLPLKAGDVREIAVGLGPIELPRYLDRPQIATHASRHELKYAEFNQWAEPLQDNITRVLSENLSHLLATDYIAVHPWPRSTPVAYQVVIQVTHFEGATGEHGRLTARWQIVDAQSQDELMRQTSRFQVSAKTMEYRAIASAMSRALGDLSQDIAAALIAVAQKRTASVTS